MQRHILLSVYMYTPLSKFVNALPESFFVFVPHFTSVEGQKVGLFFPAPCTDNLQHAWTKEDYHLLLRASSLTQDMNFGMYVFAEMINRVSPS